MNITTSSVKTAIIWIIGLAVAVIGVLQTSNLVNGSKGVGAVLAVAGVLLPVIEHYITTNSPASTAKAAAATPPPTPPAA